METLCPECYEPLEEIHDRLHCFTHDCPASYTSMDLRLIYPELNPELQVEESVEDELEAEIDPAVTYAQEILG